MSDTKDTIYIDVDEEITGIVSKIQNSPKNIVALVLPKRASALQSIVNMKLLKRTSEQNDKKLVLITSESRILPLAGAVGLFVASNLNSKPYIPPAPNVKSAAPQNDEGVGEVKLDSNKPESAPDPKSEAAAVEIDNTAKKSDAAKDGSSKPKKKKGGNKLKVPNFSSFRKKLILGAVVALLLISGLIYAIFAAPKATVTVKAQTKNLPISVDFIADSKATDFDQDGRVLRATSKETVKNESEKVEATGQKNKGEKASGNVSMTSKKCGGNPFTAPSSVPAGTGISANGVTYIVQESTSFTISGASTDSQGCYIYPATNNTSISAQMAGANGNTGNANFSVSGRADVSAKGSASGGSDNIVKVVSQGDVNKAKERLNGKGNSIQDDMKKELERDGYVPINESFKATPANQVVTPAVDTEANEVTVSVVTTYQMIGVKEDDLKQIIKDETGKNDEGKNQSVLSEGISTATIKPDADAGRLNDGQTGFTIDTTVVLGPEINDQDIKQSIVGKKSGEAENILGLRPGIESPKVELSPFWVSTIPKNHSKITIEVQQADGSEIPQ